jgi:hypothetical protein
MKTYKRIQKKSRPNKTRKRNAYKNKKQTTQLKQKSRKVLKTRGRKTRGRKNRNKKYTRKIKLVGGINYQYDPNEVVAQENLVTKKFKQHLKDQTFYNKSGIPYYYDPIQNRYYHRIDEKTEKTAWGIPLEKGEEYDDLFYEEEEDDEDDGNVCNEVDNYKKTCDDEYENQSGFGDFKCSLNKPKLLNMTNDDKKNINNYLDCYDLTCKKPNILEKCPKK